MLHIYDEWFDFVFSTSLPSLPPGFIPFLQLLLLSDPMFAFSSAFACV